jgi:hypothetical protein
MKQEKAYKIKLIKSLIYKDGDEIIEETTRVEMP